MRQVLLGVFLLSFAALTAELTLIRVFDVILTSNTSYMIVTCALFDFGVAGIWRTLRPLPKGVDLKAQGARLSLLFAVSVLLILPVSNALPLDYREILAHPIRQIAAFLTLYLIVSLPFFFVGLLLSAVFTAHAGQISRLYFWDLAGAATGALLVAPLLPYVGPGGLLVALGGVGCLAAVLFSGWVFWRPVAALGAPILLVLPFLLPSGSLEFKQHMDKRGVKTAAEQGIIEFSRWDPISKIDVFDSGDDYVQNGVEMRFKHIAYDGGQQSSYIYPFDGDLAGLRRAIEAGETKVREQFWISGVLAAEYLKADSGQKVLIIGSAGGQETKAALMYGASHVDAVEMVGTVVNLGTGAYSRYNGGIFLDPRVHVVAGEGRSYLRRHDAKYDIIQIFSNHTSSSIASGTGAMQTSYLQTAEAYQEYFSHLSENGVLQVNHHVFPKVITTAALAWREMGRTDFRSHVAIWQRPGEDHLPTILIKMQPWTAEELGRVQEWFSRFPDERNALVENPLSLTQSFLPAIFYSGDFTAGMERRSLYRLAPATDDRPYFNFLRKHIGLVHADPRGYLDEATAGLLNSQMKGPIPFDQVHLYVTSAAGLFFGLVVIVLPLLFSRAGRETWPARGAALTYFACLGGGFIIIELVFIQVLMRLIGSPLYTYTAVVAGLLLSAALGSLTSPRLGVAPKGRWAVPFGGIVASLSLFMLFNEPIQTLFLSAALPFRILAAMAMIAPVGYFLGMPFPLGISGLRGSPAGSIAWAWAMNSLFTVIGAIASVVLSLFVGFEVTLAAALGLYIVGFLAFDRMRRVASAEQPVVAADLLTGERPRRL
ncbi:MAG TPA: hypothetical protein VF194_16105 [Ferrovibrio sp.]|uniref:hypothetical protein n=1 Tax=Ferrovibrio sp. TaxID=1917215 RepID=UPI002ED47A11